VNPTMETVSLFVADWTQTQRGRKVSAATRELVWELSACAFDCGGTVTLTKTRLVVVLNVGQRFLAERVGITAYGMKSRMRSAQKIGILARHRQPFGADSTTVLELTIPDANGGSK